MTDTLTKMLAMTDEAEQFFAQRYYDAQVEVDKLTHLLTYACNWINRNEVDITEHNAALVDDYNQAPVFKLADIKGLTEWRDAFELKTLRERQEAIIEAEQGTRDYIDKMADANDTEMIRAAAIGKLSVKERIALGIKEE